MKNTTFLQILLCLLIIFSALYIRYRKETDAVYTSGNISPYSVDFSGNLTFSDLAEYMRKNKTVAANEVNS